MEEPDERVTVRRTRKWSKLLVIGLASVLVLALAVTVAFAGTRPNTPSTNEAITSNTNSPVAAPVDPNLPIAPVSNPQGPALTCPCGYACPYYPNCPYNQSCPCPSCPYYAGPTQPQIQTQPQVDPQPQAQPPQPQAQTQPPIQSVPTVQAPSNTAPTGPYTGPYNGPYAGCPGYNGTPGSAYGPGPGGCCR